MKLLKHGAAILPDWDKVRARQAKVAAYKASRPAYMQLGLPHQSHNFARQFAPSLPLPSFSADPALLRWNPPNNRRFWL